MEHEIDIYGYMLNISVVFFVMLFFYRFFNEIKFYNNDFFYAENNFGATILNHWYSCSKRDAKYVENEMYLFEQNPYIDKNFLKKSLLEACIRQDIFNDNLDNL